MWTSIPRQLPILPQEKQYLHQILEKARDSSGADSLYAVNPEKSRWEFILKRINSPRINAHWDFWGFPPFFRRKRVVVEFAPTNLRNGTFRPCYTAWQKESHLLCKQELLVQQDNVFTWKTYASSYQWENTLVWSLFSCTICIQVTWTPLGHKVVTSGPVQMWVSILHRGFVFQIKSKDSVGEMECIIHNPVVYICTRPLSDCVPDHDQIDFTNQEWITFLRDGVYMETDCGMSSFLIWLNRSPPYQTFTSSMSTIPFCNFLSTDVCADCGMERKKSRQYFRKGSKGEPLCNRCGLRRKRMERIILEKIYALYDLGFSSETEEEMILSLTEFLKECK